VAEKEAPKREGWIAKHGTAVLVSVIATVIGGAILIVLFGGGEGGSGSNTVIQTGASPAPVEKPESFEDAVRKRTIWTTPPLMASSPGYVEMQAPMESYSGDLAVTKIRELVENPDLYEGGPVLVAGKIVEQGDVAGPYLDHEFRLVGPQPGLDFYVGTSGIQVASTGSVVWVLGTLVAVGSTRDPQGNARRSAYLSVRGINQEINSVFGGAASIGSRALRKAIKEVENT
jgi:hypothetical protein